MADFEEIGCRLRAGPYLGEISALSFLPLPPRLSPLPLLLAGSGSELHLYSVRSGKLLVSLRAFDGIRVHGISLRSPPNPNSSSAEFSIAVFAERRVKLFLLRVIGAESGDLDGDGAAISWELVNQLPRFDHWVLDALFLKEDNHLVVGLSDNSIALWNISGPNVVSRVKSSEICLLYSMRLWGDSKETLRVASGTIFNEIIVWKLSPLAYQHISGQKDVQFCDNTAMDVCMSRLTGHEGSIFRIVWSSDGSRLMSVSDDRSARIWMINDRKQVGDDSGDIHGRHLSVNLVLFGHNARIWDCCVSDSIVITAGEDCSCRVWDKDGKQLLAIKEHIGRGIWRCQYDPVSSLLITAGFDSAIKVYSLNSSSLRKMVYHNGVLNELDGTEMFTICAPKVSCQLGLMDSKSEYVRCLRFTQENILYVATNNGFLYRVELWNPGDVRWMELAQVCKEAPIICMDLVSTNSSDSSMVVEDILAVGDGKGKVTVVRVVKNSPIPKVALSTTWSAERERQLLGVYWCKSLAYGHLFTANPRGTLKLWRISDALKSEADISNGDHEVSLVAQFTSLFGARIMCLDASIKKEVLICGDQRGNVTMYSFPKDLMVVNPSKIVVKPPLITQFKGAHGISSVTSIMVAALSFDQFEIRTTGGDGCICSFKYSESMQTLEFIGMKQVKELSTIQSISTNSTSQESLAQGNYAIGFTSADFIMWNLTNDTKVLQIPCGGWRRPHTYYLGVVPEYQNCFAYLKDQEIHVHRFWIQVQEKQLIPKVLHLQFHGREVHSLCFISFGLRSNPSRNCHPWIATGCEDGTVRLTRYTSVGMGSWCKSKLLGEHVGGSAVRSIHFVSKIYTITASRTCSPGHDLSERKVDQLLLLSVGAKQVLTSWVLCDSTPESEEINDSDQDSEDAFCHTPEFSSISFQWLSTHTPPKLGSASRRVDFSASTEKGNGSIVQSAMPASQLTEYEKQNPKSTLMDQSENDWRYLAVTGFLVKHANSRLTVCFIVVACSDATLTLRALLLPYRQWLDIATLVPQTSPVLVLQHVVIPGSPQTEPNGWAGDAYIIISGSTDGSVTFWDLTETVEDFMLQIVTLEPEMLIDSQRRPKTGRGSQGGRWWKSLTGQSSGKNYKDSSTKIESDYSTTGQSTENISSLRQSDSVNNQTRHSETSSYFLSSEIRKVRPFYVLNYVHQSGVNCLYVSEMKDRLQSDYGKTYCVLSGGDDQAVHYLAFDLTVKATNTTFSNIQDHAQDGTQGLPSGTSNNGKSTYQSWNNRHVLRIFSQARNASAHCAAVKGIWTDGIWAFSCGLDQRIRCWKINANGSITEHTHLIISVPEPEALDAISSHRTRNVYQIAVAGRGMQMVEFFAPIDEE
ncbi:uncharacterized protein M6B38_176215 [Iris pallida]|uniref:WD repeat-containing protein 6 n=1 Tax=Iris pallida TaxID=29817 RepID=A0AAX6EQQ1_IRIPA|nr:uncharacterized protein M6B38_176215 [Iris pallida]